MSNVTTKIQTHRHGIISYQSVLCVFVCVLCVGNYIMLTSIHNECKHSFIHTNDSHSKVSFAFIFCISVFPLSFTSLPPSLSAHWPLIKSPQLMCNCICNYNCYSIRFDSFRFDALHLFSYASIYTNIFLNYYVIRQS